MKTEASLMVRCLRAFFFWALAAALCPAQDETWARTMHLAQNHERQGRYAEAEAALMDALKRAESLGSEDPHVFATLNNLGALCQIRGRDAEAERYYRRAIHIGEKSPGAGGPALAWPLINLAFLYIRDGQYSKGEQLARRAAALPIDGLGRHQPQISARLLHIRGSVQGHRGEYSQAQALYQQALEILQRNFGPRHPDVAGIHTDLGVLYEENGLHAEAIFQFEEAVTIWREALGPGYPGLINPFTHLVNLYHHTGLASKADYAFERALRIAEGAFGPEDRRVAEILVMRAAELREVKRNSQARQLEKRAKAILVKQQPDAFRENTIDVHALLKEVRARKTKP